METTYTIASEQGNIAVTCTNAHADGRVVSSKYVANRDGTFTAYRLKESGKWANFSRGAMAAKRFGWVKQRAEEWFTA